jgi:hypothetical protein
MTITTPYTPAEQTTTMHCSAFIDFDTLTATYSDITEKVHVRFGDDFTVRLSPAQAHDLRTAAHERCRNTQLDPAACWKFAAIPQFELAPRVREVCSSRLPVFTITAWHG